MSAIPPSAYTANSPAPQVKVHVVPPQGSTTPVAQMPWHVSGGATMFTRYEAQKWARELVMSPTYRQTLEERIRDKKLAPAVEVLLLHYAWGKPLEAINLTVTPGQEDLTTLSVDELMKRAKALSDQLEEASALQDALPGEFKVA
jgi:hypothetical protein